VPKVLLNKKNNQNIKNQALACLEKKENLIEKARENSLSLFYYFAFCIEKLMKKWTKFQKYNNFKKFIINVNEILFSS